MIKPNPKSNAEIKLFCFPFAGGGVQPYIQWENDLPGNAELIIIQPPGRGVRILEDRYNEMAPLVSDLLNVVQEELDRPYVFFGHSLGSLIAFELLTKIDKKGLPLPSHFFASASRSPQSASINSAICYLPDDEFIEELKALNGTPPDILNNESLMSIFLPTIRSDIEIALRYRHENVIKFDTKITILGGERDFISKSGLAKWSENFRVTEALDIYDGDHFFINDHKDKIVRQITSVLEQLSR